MSRIEYIEKRFTRKSLKTIQDANDIIAEYQAQGFTLTLRQLYYQFVSRDLLPNEQTEYKRLGSIINDARLAGLIDWTSIEDRTRNLRGDYSYSSLADPADILNDAASGHDLDHWEDQDNYVEVWIEKDALIGVIEKVCYRRKVPYFACRGYSSQSEQWSAGQRFIEKMQNGKHVHILHLGDHDPSGIDMTRDNEDRINMFTSVSDVSNGSFTINRLALNIDQVRQYNPPPNPAKDTDARFKGYKANFGEDCWELDALEPRVISKLVDDNIKSLINIKKWKATDAACEAEKEVVFAAARKLAGE